jgi:uroporphyrinogen-III synthase
MAARGNKPVILVTRPQPGANETAARLAAMGMTPIVLPLTETVALPLNGADMPGTDFDGVVMTSASAARHAPDWLVNEFRARPAYAVGHATEAAAKTRGFERVMSADGDVGDLISLIRAHESRGARLLYPCGRVRTGDLEGRLSETGMEAAPIEVYDTIKVSYMTYEQGEILGELPADGVLFHSRLSAEAFTTSLMPRYSKRLENTIFFVMSERVANGLNQDLPNRIVAATRPTEHDLLNTVAATFRLGRH